MRMFRPALALAATALVAGSLATSTTAAPAPAVKTTAPMTVMTMNLYLGSSLKEAVAASTDPVKFLGAAATVYENSQRTNFPRRAGWMAMTIKAAKPDVLVINEATNWIAKAPAGTNLPSYDFLAILQRALAKEGLSYKVAVTVDNANIGWDQFTGIPYINPAKAPACDGKNIFACHVRLKDRDVILYNAKNPQLKLVAGSAKKGTYKAQESFTVAGRTVSFGRGWAQATFTYSGKKVAVIGTHLEVETPAGSDPLATPSTFGPASWPSPTQVAEGKELLALAAAAKKSAGRVIVAGDLNSDGNGLNSITHANLTKSLLADTYFKSGGKKGKGVGATCCQTGMLDNPTVRFGDSIAPLRIDHILVSSGLVTVPGSARGVGNTKRANTVPMWESDHGFYLAKVRLAY